MGWLTDLVWEMDAPGNGLLVLYMPIKYFDVYLEKTVHSTKF